VSSATYTIAPTVTAPIPPPSFTPGQGTFMTLQMLHSAVQRLVASFITHWMEHAHVSMSNLRGYPVGPDDDYNHFGDCPYIIRRSKPRRYTDLHINPCKPFYISAFRYIHVREDHLDYRRHARGCDLLHHRRFHADHPIHTIHAAYYAACVSNYPRHRRTEIGLRSCVNRDLYYPGARFGLPAERQPSCRSNCCYGK